MSRKAICVMLGLLVLLLMLPASCTSETTPSPTTTEATTTEPTTTTSASANWWDDLGEPQYGGTITRHTDGNGVGSLNLDNWSNFMGPDARLLWTERLFAHSWTVDRDEFSFTAEWVPPDYLQGQLAESWEQPDSQTLVITIRQGVYWRDVAPVNGREFTASDVQFNYERMLGIGSFTEPNPFYAGDLSNIESVTATDDYTVEFKFKEPAPMALDTLSTNSGFGFIAPEWLEQGDPEDWQNAVGTGPWILTEWDKSVSMTFSRNPDYWGVDERHPENQIPYADELRAVAIEDMTTSLAALRTGKIDTLFERTGPSLQQVEALAKTNPEINQAYWQMAGLSLGTRCDVEPFNNLKVRTAMQMAINLEEIAQSYYGGTVSGTPAGFLHPVYSDWTTPYEEWPAELQAEYSYDPEGAKALLAEAGYPDGFETNIIVGDVFDLSLLQVMKAYLMDIGIDMEIQVSDMATFNSLQSTKTFDQINYTAMSGVTAGPSDFTAFTTGHAQNYWFNDDPTYDAMCAEMFTAASIDEMKTAAKELELYFLSQHWQVATLPYVNVVLWQPWIKGCSGEVTQGGTQNMGTYYARFWVDQDLKASLTD